VGAAVFQVFIGYIFSTITNFVDFSQLQWPKIVQHSLKLKIELMEEFSEAKIYKIMPELGNGNINADCFYSSAEICESVARCTEFVYDKT